MLPFVQVVFFDVDGVLLDSLPQHLAICRAYAEKFRLNVRIPSVEEFRRWVSQGTKVSPMRDFFLAVKFPDDLVDEAVAGYERDFMRDFPPPAFPGVEKMLERVVQDGWQLGLVTSNTRENVEPALADSMALFAPALRFYHEPNKPPVSKRDRLLQGAHVAQAETANCVFVGDQPADEKAARDAGVHFLGVTYGWGILPGATHGETVDSVDEIPGKLAPMRKA